MSTQDGSTRLYLIVEATEGAVARLGAALRSVPVASVLIMPATGQRLTEAEARPLVELVQSQDIAALVIDDAALALALDADGVHLSASDDPQAAYRAARELLGRRRIVGADAGALRHNAMLLAEEGADYVGFGLAQDIADIQEAAEERLERVEWWAEIFETPCVAFDVATVEEAQLLASAGADFIGMVLPAGDQAAVSDSVRAMAQGLTGAVTT